MGDAEQNKLFVGGISWDTTEDVLKDHFGQYGVVLGSAIARDRISGNPRALLLSRSPNLPPLILRTRIKFLAERTKKIFVGGLSASLTEEEFRNYFEKFGRITDVVVMHDNLTHRPRGFGFITFELEDSIEEVMQKNFHELTGKLVEVKKAVPKDGISGSSIGYNGRVGGGRSPNFNSYQQGSYAPYNSRFGYFPTGYGNVGSYPCGAGIFGVGYPSGGYSGMGYGLTPMAPRSPWNPAMVGVRGSFLPYGSAPPLYRWTWSNGAFCERVKWDTGWRCSTYF